MMKPHLGKHPLWRPPLNLSVPKLVLLSTLIVLVVNIFHHYPRLHPSESSTSSSLSASPSSPPPIPLPVVVTSPSSLPSLSSSLLASSSPAPVVVSSSYSTTSIPPPPPSPPPPPPAPISTWKADIERPTARECDITRGEWVWDPESPRYTNLTCSMIQEHQNCMKFGRPDRDFLKWRWQPDGCELPRFDPERFLQLMRGKSMAFIGDSLARNQMQSLMCLLSRIENPEDITVNKDDNPKSMLYTKYNFTISIFWSPFLIKAEEATKGPFNSNFYNLHLDVADKNWASRIHHHDYLIVSGGNWFNRPSQFFRRRRKVGCLYCNQPDITQLDMRYSNKMAFRTALRAINNKKNGFKGTVILRTLSPSHFENGVWDKGGDCVRTRPFARNETRMEKKERELYRDQVVEFGKAEVEGRMRGVEFRLLDSSGAMLLRPDGHPSRYGHWPEDKVDLYNDCVHWCLPGPVDTMNDFLFHLLRQREGRR